MKCDNTKGEINMNTIEQLELKLEKLLKELEDYKPESDEHKGKLNEIKEVGDLLNKFKVSACEEENNRKNYEIKIQQMRADNVDRTVAHTLAALGLLVSIGMGYWTFRYDEKGTITSTLGRQILQRFIPRK